jgi:putative ABC transport system substrate-binding protein
MRRRELLVILGGAAALPIVARAQKDLPVVAVLVPGPAKNAENRMVAIRQGMREAGLTEGINFTFASRYADGVFDRLPALALNSLLSSHASSLLRPPRRRSRTKFCPNYR